MRPLSPCYILLPHANLSEIGQSAAELRQKLFFKRRLSAVLTMQNLSEIGQSAAELRQKTIF